jgi:hypothetical protein
MLLHFILRQEETPPRPSLQHPIHHPTTLRHDYFHHRQQSLQAVRAFQITFYIYMGTLSSKADLFALPIPAERVILRIVSNHYHHRSSPSFSPTPPIHPQQLDGLDLLQYPLACLLPIVQERKWTSQLRIQKFSEGWLPVGRIRHRIDSDDPDSCPAAWVERKPATTSCGSASTVAPKSTT